ncbi:MAG: hypothetical protein E6Q98_22985 [Rhodospirillaceae bacterium]|nr:MAG: hypothetical protein E6Q98_22985 [Rhodospirillaceae bacterium]
MRHWVKWGLILFVGSAVLSGINSALQDKPPQNAKLEQSQTEAEKKKENECRRWLRDAAVKGYTPLKIDVVFVSGEPGILVYRLPWMTAPFEVKENLVESYECVIFKGQDKRTAISIFDAKTHQRLGHYNGIELTIP